MAKKEQPTVTVDRWTYLWLALGAIFLMLSYGQFRVALTAWIAPVFLIRFFRTQRVGKGYLLTLLGLFVAFSISWYPIMATFGPGVVVLLFTFSIALLNTLPYLADRLMTPVLKGFAGTFVFPLAMTVNTFLYNQFSPMGSFGMIGYEQYSNQALIQIVSVTGMWGLTFLVSWLGPLVNWVWEQSFAWPRVRRGLAVWAGVMVVVLVYGGLRLALGRTAPGTVRVHTLSVATDFDKMPDLNMDPEGYRRFNNERNEQLIQESIRQANLGAQIVLWSEMAAAGIAEDMAKLNARAREVARQEGIYLAMGQEIHYPEQERPWENKIVVIDPTGEVIIDHDKFGATFIYGMMGVGEALQGDYTIQTAETPVGTLTGAVCWDADFPMTIRQAGRQNADILLVANGDGEAHAELHMQQHVFRAIENGFALVRHDAWSGISVATDPYGRILSMVDLRSASTPVMTAQVPTQGVFTLYPIIGDLLAWLALVAFVIYIVWTIVVLRREAVASPVPRPAV